MEDGLVQLGNSDALGTGSLIVNGGTVDLHGYSITVSVLASKSTTTASTWLITNLDTTSSTLTVNQDKSTAFFADVQDGSGTVSVVMAGTGTLIVLGNNTYTAGTTISSGTFIVTAASAMPENTSLTVGAGRDIRLRSHRGEFLADDTGAESLPDTNACHGRRTLCQPTCRPR